MKISKTFVALVFCTLFVSGVFAQAPLELGEKQVNVGVSSAGAGTPIYAGFDYCIESNITIGAEFEFLHYKGAFSFGFLANGNYHFNNILKIPSKFDFYAGVGLGVYNGKTLMYSLSNFVIGLQAGGRYFLNESLGLNLEFGFLGGKIGLTYKF